MATFQHVVFGGRAILVLTKGEARGVALIIAKASRRLPIVFNAALVAAQAQQEQRNGRFPPLADNYISDPVQTFCSCVVARLGRHQAPLMERKQILVL